MMGGTCYAPNERGRRAPDDLRRELMDAVSRDDATIDISPGSDSGSPFRDPDDNLPVSRVREGMEVIDAEGKKIGKVVYVHLGDPDAYTVTGEEEEQPAGLLDLIDSVFGQEPKVPEEVRERLLHDGFIKVDGGLLGPTRYALAGQIARVSGDTVYLADRKEELVKEE
jgi:hypothetical protein